VQALHDDVGAGPDGGGGQIRVEREVRAPGLVHQQRNPMPLAGPSDGGHVRAGAVLGRRDDQHRADARFPLKSCGDVVGRCRVGDLALVVPARVEPYRAGAGEDEGGDDRFVHVAVTRIFWPGPGPGPVTVRTAVWMEMLEPQVANMACRAPTASASSASASGTADLAVMTSASNTPGDRDPGGALVDAASEAVAGQGKGVLVLAPEPLDGVEDGSVVLVHVRRIPRASPANRDLPSSSHGIAPV
jgi:hypothetical protein